MSNKYNYTGQGIAYPLQISNGTTLQFEGVSLLGESIRRILLTPRGKTFFNPAFGSEMYQLRFEPNDIVFEDLADVFIRQAVGTWEKRVEVQDIQFTHFDDVVEIELSYKILNSNQIEGLVFPFYRQIN